MTPKEIRNKYLGEVSDYNEDEYREEIRKKAEKLGVNYKENYSFNNNNNNFGGARSNKTKTILIVSGLLVLASAGTFIYFKKYRHHGKK